MLDTEDLRFFAAIAAASSLAAAARALDVSPPAVTQRLQSLERRLGIALVDRTGRRLGLTHEGELLAERSRDIVGALQGLEDALAERRGEVVGHLRVVAPFGFGRRYVAPLVEGFLARHPRLAVELTLADRPGRAPAETWDIAIHIGSLAETAAGLTLRQLAANERILCAAPAYLGRHGSPAVPDDLRRHSCIALRENDEDVTLWRFRRAGGDGDVRVRVEPRLASNDGEVVKAWALAGLGLIVRSEWDVADDLRAGRLVRVLADHSLPAAPIVALLGSRSQARSARTRRFLEALAEAFREPPWRVATDVRPD